MTRTIPISILLFAFIGVSCIKDDHDPDKNCPSKSNLIYDWSHGKSLSATDSLMIVSSDGTAIFLKTDNVGTILNLRPGTYSLVAYEPSAKIHVKGTTLTLPVGIDGYVTEPSAMSAGLTSFSVGLNETRPHILPMYYQTRELIIQLNISGLGSSTLSSVQGWLDGIAVSRDLANGFTPFDGIARHPALIGGKIAYVLTEKPQTTLVKRFEASKRLLGIDGPATQMLNLTFGFTGGYRETVTDVTSALDTFHTDNVYEPFMIVIDIFINEDFSADIVDWKAGSQSDIEAQ